MQGGPHGDRFLPASLHDPLLKRGEENPPQPSGPLDDRLLTSGFGVGRAWIARGLSLVGARLHGTSEYGCGRTMEIMKVLNKCTDLAQAHLAPPLGQRGAGGSTRGRRSPREVIGWLGLVAVIFSVIGCVLPFQQGIKQEDQRSRVTAENRASPNEKGLIKPQRASESGSLARGGEPGHTNPQAGTGRAGQKPEVTGGHRKVWEDQKVKTAAQEMARGFPAVKKIQVCYQVEADEWWVTLYDDMGVEIDLKQFTWNRDQEKLEPFLVLKRVPASRLDAHLTTKRPGMACEIVEPMVRLR